MNRGSGILFGGNTGLEEGGLGWLLVFSTKEGWWQETMYAAIEMIG